MNSKPFAFALLAMLAMAFGGFSPASAAGAAGALVPVIDRGDRATSPIINVRTTCDRWGCGPRAEERQRARIDGRFGRDAYRHRGQSSRDWHRDRPRYNYHRGGPSIHLYVEPAPRYRPRYHTPSPPRYSLPRAHVRWCNNRYRSYRAWDNSFQPYHGPRRQCMSPYYS